MVAAWEYNLNRESIQMEKNKMTLENILSPIKDIAIDSFELNPDFPTIKYITKEIYESDVYKYVTPNFYEADRESGAISKTPKFILFSAPGATGKTALAKHICYTKGGVYWDLPDSKVAEYSFQGALVNSLGYAKLGDFIKSVNDGENFFVIDAFDEAEAGSGRTGIEFFLRDLCEVTAKSENVCAILLARTESALFIKNFCKNNNIVVKHYEVGHFAEYNAKTYIKYKFERKSIQFTEIANQCIDEQFKEIHRIFGNEDAEAFLGYAPVLDALATSYDDERNTLNLLKATANGEKNCVLVQKILEGLLVREREKFCKAFQVKAPNCKISEQIYSPQEQISRIFGLLLLNDSHTFVSCDGIVPIEYKDEYLEVVNTQLVQHPFINAKTKGNDFVYDFAGAAFYDYVVASLLADDDLHEYVFDYFSEHGKYCPSQLLVEFYEILSHNSIKGRFIDLMYNSFDAHRQVGDQVLLRVHGDSKECFTEFEMIREGVTHLSLEFKLEDLSKGICLSQFTNCYIDVAGKVIIGDKSEEARINNSIIICDELCWNSENVLIEAYSPGECILYTNNMLYTLVNPPRFEIKTDDKKNLKVSAQNMNQFYKLMPYQCTDIFLESEGGFIAFANTVRRIFSCLRSHSKDTPARKMDFIDNRIVGFSEYKNKVLQFLLFCKILYTDEQDWLYKLDTSKLSQYSIKWQEVRDGNLESIKVLFSEFEG